MSPKCQKRSFSPRRIPNAGRTRRWVADTIAPQHLRAPVFLRRPLCRVTLVSRLVAGVFIRRLNCLQYAIQVVGLRRLQGSEGLVVTQVSGSGQNRQVSKRAIVFQFAPGSGPNSGHRGRLTSTMTRHFLVTDSSQRMQQYWTPYRSWAVD
jgi:hypothetical protein